MPAFSHIQHVDPGRLHSLLLSSTFKKQRDDPDIISLASLFHVFDGQAQLC